MPAPTPPHPTSTLFPYTTLFRSNASASAVAQKHVEKSRELGFRHDKGAFSEFPPAGGVLVGFECGVGKFGNIDRSEEHTSELQSRLHLVCRLLLEKKKNLHSIHT